MAFKSFEQYQEDKNGEFFVLPNDGDYADVIFLYRSTRDVLVADVHYLSTATYKGYAHCCGKGCPACSYGEKGLKPQNKIFIPLFNITKGKIEFWDRTTFFEQKLQTDVFKNFPNPSECVFRITRHGASGSRETTYEIIPVGRNAAMPYEKICADFNVTFPESYSRICREMTIAEMSAAFASNGNSAVTGMADYGYTPVPRATYVPEGSVTPTVSTPVYSEPPASIPDGSIVPADVTEFDAELDEAGVSDANTDECTDDLDNVSF